MTAEGDSTALRVPIRYLCFGGGGADCPITEKRLCLTICLQNPELHASSLPSAESLRCRFLSFALLGSLIRAGDDFFVMVQIFATGSRKILDEFR